MGVAPGDGGPLGTLREAWDRVIASDPGLVRARMAISAAVAMTTALLVEYGYASAIGAGQRGVLVAMMLGGVVAMMGSMALAGTSVRPKLRTGVFFPVAFGAGMLPGALVAGRTDVMLTVFVAVMFVAVWARRFGPAFFFYGFMLWMGYFFAAFLDASVDEIPSLLEDVLVGTGVSILLSVTVLRTHPRRTLRRVQRAFGARARAVARAAADLLTADGDPRRTARAQRRLHARELRLAEAALMIEAWTVEPGVLPRDWSGPELRRRLLDAQLAIDELAHAATALAAHGGDLVYPAARVAGHLARREYPAVLYAAGPLLRAEKAGAEVDVEDAELRRAFELLGAVALTIPAATGAAPAAAQPLPVGPQAAAVRLARAAVDYVVLASESADPTAAGPDEAPAELVPAATFTLGMLPGSASIAGDLQARGGRWNPLSRAKLTTRQAVQVALAGALAIILGRQISEVRYYWAVIATFVTFTGTATRSETSLKAVNRVLGTLAGLGAGIGLAEATAGHTLLVLAVIVLAMTCGFYVVNLSYAAMIVFVTIMVSQLYSVLHEFTPGLLVLRLEETSLGAAIGIAVGLVVLPTSTRETVSAAQRAFLEALASVLQQTAAAWEGDASADPTASVRTMEDRLRRFALVARPLTRPLISGADPALMRRRIGLHTALSRHARALAATTPGPERDPAFAQACRDLARIVTGLPPDGDTAPARTYVRA
ncbi:FUSC family protein [Actinospica robiniae]|uniref:FUSC family protein n=1 Tax=Actinospica robiniae TaxID=304901 RepID=UPI00040D37F1|nr:FUSC family protein [Actinospica robiniae]